MKTRNRIIALVVAAIFIATTAMSASVYASSNVPLATVPKLRIGNCPTQSFLTGAPNGTVVLNVRWTVKNDEDSGLSGYWALDYYTNSLEVWQLSNGNFYAEKIYSGNFQTPQGAVSPGTQAGDQNTSVFGTMYGGYNLTFSGTFTPGGKPRSGNLGVKDYGGLLSDVLLGKYGNGQTGDTHAYDWTTTYFTGFSTINELWGWAYLLNGKFHVPFETYNQWCNYYSGTTGDIYYPAL